MYQTDMVLVQKYISSEIDQFRYYQFRNRSDRMTPCLYSIIFYNKSYYLKCNSQLVMYQCIDTHEHHDVHFFFWI